MDSNSWGCFGESLPCFKICQREFCECPFWGFGVSEVCPFIFLFCRFQYLHIRVFICAFSDVPFLRFWKDYCRTSLLSHFWVFIWAFSNVLLLGFWRDSLSHFCVLHFGHFLVFHFCFLEGFIVALLRFAFWAFSGIALLRFWRDSKLHFGVLHLGFFRCCLVAFWEGFKIALWRFARVQFSEVQLLRLGRNSFRPTTSYPFSAVWHADQVFLVSLFLASGFLALLFLFLDYDSAPVNEEL